MLKTPAGTMGLFAVQAIALREAWTAGGLFASLSVSAGKTLLSLLLARVLCAKKPVLVVPAKLAKHKTPKEILELSRHWQFGVIPVIVSYESLGVVTGKGTLEDLAPDLLIFDEAHKLRNPKAARTRRVDRYLKAHPDCKVCCMTGTTIKRALSDYAHLIRWCLKSGSPLPLRHDVLEEWDLALSEKVDLAFQRIGPGALLNWARPGEIEDLGELNAGRRAFQRRLAETPGVVCYHVAREDITAEIQISGINTFELPGYETSGIEAAFEGMRRLWTLPDGQELVEGLEIYRHAQEIALGFYCKWKYPAPRDWLEKRKAFSGFIRAELSGSRTYDSPDEVAQAFPSAQEVLDWQGVRKQYEPETIIVWVDSGPLKCCVEWLRGGGIVFTSHVQFGEALAQLAGVPYFGAGGLDSKGHSIESFQGRACVASVYANGEGRNLHLRPHPENPKARLGFERMLICSMLRNGPEWEQTIGRLHRLGCLAEEIGVDVLIGCREHVLTFEQCLRDADLAKYSDGGEPKLLQATIDIISSCEMPKGLAAFRQSATV
jgi:hypothetical protein